MAAAAAVAPVVSLTGEFHKGWAVKASSTLYEDESNPASLQFFYPKPTFPTFDRGDLLSKLFALNEYRSLVGTQNMSYVITKGGVEIENGTPFNNPPFTSRDHIVIVVKQALTKLRVAIPTGRSKDSLLTSPHHAAPRLRGLSPHSVSWLVNANIQMGSKSKLIQFYFIPEGPLFSLDQLKRGLLNALSRDSECSQFRRLGSNMKVTNKKKVIKNETRVSNLCRSLPIEINMILRKPTPSTPPATHTWIISFLGPNDLAPLSTFVTIAGTYFKINNVISSIIHRAAAYQEYRGIPFTWSATNNGHTITSKSKMGDSQFDTGKAIEIVWRRKRPNCFVRYFCCCCSSNRVTNPPVINSSTPLNKDDRARYDDSESL